MAQLVDRLLEQPFALEVGPAWLGKSMIRNNRARSGELRLAKNERQDGNEKIQRADAEDAHAGIGRAGPFSQATQQLRGVILVAARFKRETRVDPIGFRVAVKSLRPLEPCRQRHQPFAVGRLQAYADETDSLYFRNFA